MALNSGNIYSIPENPVEEERYEERYCKLSVKETSFSEVTKKYSCTSLPEKTCILQKSGLSRKENSIPILITTKADEHIESITESKIVQQNCNRLCMSLIDFSKLSLDKNNLTVLADKQIGFQNTKSSGVVLEKSSKSSYSSSYLEIQDYSRPNQEPLYETLLSPTVCSVADLNQESKAADFDHEYLRKHRKESEALIFIDLNKDEDSQQTTENHDGPTVSRSRSRSVQWIQNTFQNVSNRYKNFVELRRPSDIVEERIRKSNEGLDMEESETEVTSDINSSSMGPRRFSENVIGKQKRIPFVSRLGHWKDLWKDRNLATKRQEEKDIDQTRTDVCPLFNFPRKRDEDELILDALRQAMRKCTAVDPSSRPSSTIVLDQLSKLMYEC